MARTVCMLQWVCYKWCWFWFRILSEYVGQESSASKWSNTSNFLRVHVFNRFSDTCSCHEDRNAILERITVCNYLFALFVNYSRIRNSITSLSFFGISNLTHFAGKQTEMENLTTYHLKDTWSSKENYRETCVKND